jgi:hypothetical protein
MKSELSSVHSKHTFAAQTLFCTVILMFSYTLSEPANNINCVFGLGAQPQSYVHAWLYLAAVMVYVPVAFYLPVHLLLWKLGWDQTRV